jgi:hypothetical protein
MTLIVSNNSGVVAWFTSYGKQDPDGLYCSRDNFRVDRPATRAQWETAFRALLAHTQSHIGTPTAYAQVDL